MSGKRTSVYLEEEVLASAHRLGINVSEVCTRALKREIDTHIEKLVCEVEAGRQAALQLEQIRGWVTEEVEPPSESLITADGQLKNR